MVGEGSLYFVTQVGITDNGKEDGNRFDRGKKMGLVQCALLWQPSQRLQPEIT